MLQIVNGVLQISAKEIHEFDALPATYDMTEDAP
jgi:hypothetical protein